jgi:hypothetical protein
MSELSVKVQGLDDLLKQFDTFGKQVEGLHKEVPQQLVEWQTEDMRRKYPNIKVEETQQSVEASTEIWPRSRLESEPGYKRPRPTPKKGPTMARVKIARINGAGRPPPSTRPLLRTELFTKLVDRMTKWP